jgi:hypothetical protein
MESKIEGITSRDGMAKDLEFFSLSSLSRDIGIYI